MLRAAGIMTRLAFSNDMSELDAKLKRSVEPTSKNSTPSAQVVSKFVPEALHILKTYTFGGFYP